MNITFTINHHKSQQLLLFTADIMFINLLVNKLCLNLMITLTFIVQTFNSIFVLLVQSFLCGSHFNHCTHLKITVYILQTKDNEIMQ